MASKSRPGRRAPQRPKRVVTLERATPAPSGRYTPPSKHVRIRPTWHRVVGAVEAFLGLALIAVNYIQYETAILPGGHSELYFVAGLGIAGGSLWWFGAFDRPQ